MGDLTRLGRSVRKLASGRGRRYPVRLKKRIFREALTSHDEGMSWSAIAKAVGVPIDTLRRWLAAGDVETGSMKPVVVADAIMLTTHEVAVVTPAGYRVEGLDVNGGFARTADRLRQHP